ncbi:hypothetical protein BCR35DRAFT_334284 [Leucosporidium creatinivorum]|uniref:BTB domain-containing protein n=1 Tax=Leucosporidium creatinivorum TaxID=106004 RepID=A0A1Y2ECZ8_9BASI|nr:hypothetical protein BCR35DRAFT_334284 [Leucosporidium creatinivorum]
MSKAVEIVETGLMRLTWDLHLDLLDETLHFSMPLRTRGHWGYRSRRRCFSGAVLAGQRKQTDYPPLRSLEEIRRISTPVPRGPSLDMRHTSKSDVQVAEFNNNRFKRLTHRRYRFVFTLKYDRAPLVALHALPNKAIKINCSSSVHTKRPNDVRLFFPDLNAELWESSSFLSASSPYFKTLLASDDFTESVRRSRKRPKIEEREVIVLDHGLRAGSRARSATASESHAGEEEEEEEGDGDDSDEDSDDFIKRRSPPSIEDTSNDGDFTYREVKITETAYTTYCAVPLYLHSSHITFAPLASNLLPHNPDAKQTREQLVDQHLSSTPSQPFPVSPKSVYRLAHLLEIPSLCALALAELKSQLTFANAAKELFSSISVYDDAREPLLEFVVEHWKEVKASAGMKEVEAMVKAGELPSAGVVYAELLPRLA